MHKVLDDSKQLLLSLSVNELETLTRLLDAARDKPGADQEIAAMLDALHAGVHVSRREQELVQVWSDQGAVMLRVMNTFGDPVELGEAQARAFARQLEQVADEAVRT
jgi:hypothetical protein